MTPEEKTKIIATLNEKGADKNCTRCGRNDFGIVDGYFTNPIQPNISNIVLGGTTIPTVVVVCTNCGLLSQHALGVLGLLPKMKKTDTNTPDTNVE